MSMDQEMKGAAERTSYAAIWLVGARMLAKSFDLITLLVLTHLLAPADFGLVALAMTFILIVESILEIPVASALLRAQALKPSMLDTAFTLSLMRGAGVAVLLAAVAYPAAQFYGEPRLAPLIAALSVAPALRSMVSPRMAVYGRDLDFRRDFAIEVAGKAAALAIAVFVAVTTQSYWAIAVATLTSPVVMTVVSYGLAPYRPVLSLKEWREFADILSWNTLSQVAMAVNWQLDRLLLGRFVTDVLLGLYVVAQTLTATPFQMFVIPVLRPFTAAFRLKTENQSAGKAYLTASAAVFTIVAPMLALLTVLAEPLIVFLMGAEWGGGAIYVQLLAATGLLRMPVQPVNSLLISRNQTKFIAFQSMIELAVKLPVAVYAIMQFGVFGAILARALGFFVNAVLAMLFLRHVINLSIRRQIAVLIRPLSGLTALVAAATLALHLSSGVMADGNVLGQFAGLVLAGGAGVLSYLAVIFGLWRINGGGDGIEKLAVKIAGGLVAKIRLQRAVS